MTADELKHASDTFREWQRLEKLQTDFRGHEHNYEGDKIAVTSLIAGDMADISKIDYEPAPKTWKQLRAILDDDLDMRRAEYKVTFQNL